MDNYHWICECSHSSFLTVSQHYQNGLSPPYQLGTITITLVVVGLIPWRICKSKGGLGRVGSESSPGDHYHIDNLYNPNFIFILQDKSFIHCQKWKQKVFVVLDVFKINFYCFIGFLR